MKSPEQRAAMMSNADTQITPRPSKHFLEAAQPRVRSDNEQKTHAQLAVTETRLRHLEDRAENQTARLCSMDESHADYAHAKELQEAYSQQLTNLTGVRDLLQKQAEAFPANDGAYEEAALANVEVQEPTTVGLSKEPFAGEIANDVTAAQAEIMEVADADIENISPTEQLHDVIGQFAKAQNITSVEQLHDAVAKLQMIDSTELGEALLNKDSDIESSIGHLAQIVGEIKRAEQRLIDDQHATSDTVRKMGEQILTDEEMHHLNDLLAIASMQTELFTSKDAQPRETIPARPHNVETLDETEASREEEKKSLLYKDIFDLQRWNFSDPEYLNLIAQRIPLESLNVGELSQAEKKSLFNICMKAIEAENKRFAENNESATIAESRARSEESARATQHVREILAELNQLGEGAVYDQYAKQSAGPKTAENLAISIEESLSEFPSITELREFNSQTLDAQIQILKERKEEGYPESHYRRLLTELIPTRTGDNRDFEALYSALEKPDQDYLRNSVLDEYLKIVQEESEADAADPNAKFGATRAKLERMLATIDPQAIVARTTSPEMVSPDVTDGRQAASPLSPRAQAFADNPDNAVGRFKTPEEIENAARLQEEARARVDAASKKRTAQMEVGKRGYEALLPQVEGRQAEIPEVPVPQDAAQAQAIPEYTGPESMSEQKKELIVSAYIKTQHAITEQLLSLQSIHSGYRIDAQGDVIEEPGFANAARRKMVRFNGEFNKGRQRLARLQGDLAGIEQRIANTHGEITLDEAKAAYANQLAAENLQQDLPLESVESEIPQKSLDSVLDDAQQGHFIELDTLAAMVTQQNIDAAMQQEAFSPADARILYRAIQNAVSAKAEEMRSNPDADHGDADEKMTRLQEIQDGLYDYAVPKQQTSGQRTDSSLSDRMNLPPLHTDKEEVALDKTRTEGYRGPAETAEDNRPAIDVGPALFEDETEPAAKQEMEEHETPDSLAKEKERVDEYFERVFVQLTQPLTILDNGKYVYHNDKDNTDWRFEAFVERIVQEKNLSDEGKDYALEKLAQWWEEKKTTARKESDKTASDNESIGDKWRALPETEAQILQSIDRLIEDFGAVDLPQSAAGLTTEDQQRNYIQKARRCLEILPALNIEELKNLETTSKNVDIGLKQDIDALISGLQTIVISTRSAMQNAEWITGKPDTFSASDKQKINSARDNLYEAIFKPRLDSNKPSDEDLQRDIGKPWDMYKGTTKKEQRDLKTNVVRTVKKPQDRPRPTA